MEGKEGGTVLGARSERAEGRRAGNVLIEPDKAVPSSRELAESELAAILSRELAKDASFDFFDAIDGGRSGRGFSSRGASWSDRSEVCVEVGDDILIEGTELDSCALEGGSDVILWRGVSWFIIFAKNL